jgi:hypothetical protein
MESGKELGYGQHPAEPILLPKATHQPVIPAQAGTHAAPSNPRVMVSRMRGNDSFSSSQWSMQIKQEIKKRPERAVLYAADQNAV